jgi:hypothetical protein
MPRAMPRRVRHLHGRYAETCDIEPYIQIGRMVWKQVRRNKVDNKFRGPYIKISSQRPVWWGVKENTLLFSPSYNFASTSVEHEEDWCIVPVINLEDSDTRFSPIVRCGCPHRRKGHRAMSGGCVRIHCVSSVDRGKYEFETHGSLRFAVDWSIHNATILPWIHKFFHHAYPLRVRHGAVDDRLHIINCILCINVRGCSRVVHHGSCNVRFTDPSYGLYTTRSPVPLTTFRF